MNKIKVVERLKSISAYGSIVFFVIIAFEVMIMISPFAFFFYSVFNPVFKWLNQYAATGWLTTFFLPHMILPPTLFLKGIRITGSILFVLGAFTFLVCVSQVYFNKIFKKGVAVKGLYSYIRHPQYMALGVWGIGMAILWPRFIVLASLSLMFVLYYFLAKDEERRMSSQFGTTYEQYLKNTGMFVPHFIGKHFSFASRLSAGILVPLIVVTTVIGSGFILRAVTLRQISFDSNKNITLVSILPEDTIYGRNVLESVSGPVNSEKLRFLENKNDYLGYLMPADYVMQGMIANTGGDFHLYKQHHTIAMISDWVLHPFGHLRRSPSEHMAKMHKVDPAFARRHHCPIGINDEKLDCKNCPYRRVVFVEVDNNEGKRLSGRDILSLNTMRKPAGFIDINVLTGEIVNAKEVEKTSAWHDVPTPAI